MTSVIVSANRKMLNLMPWRNGRLTYLKLFILVFHFTLLIHIFHSQTEIFWWIQDFHVNYVLVPADKAANNVVVAWRLYYINTLKCELVDTNAYELQPSLSERVEGDRTWPRGVVYRMGNISSQKLEPSGASCLSGMSMRGGGTPRSLEGAPPRFFT